MDKCVLHTCILSYKKPNVKKTVFIQVFWPCFYVICELAGWSYCIQCRRQLFSGLCMIRFGRTKDWCPYFTLMYKCVSCFSERIQNMTVTIDEMLFYAKVYRWSRKLYGISEQHSIWIVLFQTLYDSTQLLAYMKTKYI